MYYKALQQNREAPYSGITWPEIGGWIEAEGELKPCQNGIHLCRRGDLVQWLEPHLYEVEVDESELIDAWDKIVVRRARLVRHLDTWNERTRRLFAADCAERVVHLAGPKEVQAIAVARRFAVGEASREELRAARDPAGYDGAASWAAAEAAAAEAAADAGYAAKAAIWAAGDAAGAASWAASWAAGDAAEAARDAAAYAGDAERAAQTEILFGYIQ